MTLLLTFSLPYCLKQIDSLLPCVCSVIDHRICQNVIIRTSLTAFQMVRFFLLNFMSMVNLPGATVD